MGNLNSTLKEVGNVKKEISPAVTWTAVVVVALLAIFFGFRLISAPPPNTDKKGADDAQARVQQGGKLYEPPAGAPVPGAGGKRPDGRPMGPGGFNLTPPSH